MDGSETEVIPTSVRLTRADLSALDQVAAAKGYRRGELIRRLIRRGVKYADDIPPADREGAVRPQRPRKVA